MSVPGGVCRDVCDSVDRQGAVPGRRLGPDLVGSGTSDKSIRSGQFQIGGQLGYLFTKELEGGVRQSFGYAHVLHGGEDYNGTTVGFVDYHFDLNAIQPFIGGNVGLSYGTHEKGTGSFGPEGGVKVFLNSTTYVFGIIQYEISMRNSDDSSFVYGVGLGVRL